MEKVQRLVCQFVYFLLIITGAFVAGACSGRHSFVIDGKVMDGGNGTVYIFKYGNKDFHLIDSAAYTDGHFTYKSETEQPLLYGLSLNPEDTEPQSFFIGEDTLHLSFWKTGKEVIASNSPLNDNYLSMREKAAGATEQSILRYVHDNASSPVAAFFVWHDWSWRLDVATLRLIYDTFDSRLKDCIYLRQLHDLIIHMENVQPGKNAPEKAGEESGQQTVLLFFASWCSDCRNELPSIKKVVLQHRNTRFIGFSLDVNKAALKQFEKENPHLFEKIMSDYKGWDSPIVQMYAVRWIPAFFLISKDGKIEKITHSAEALF